MNERVRRGDLPIARRDIMLRFQLMDILAASGDGPVFDIMEPLAERLNTYNDAVGWMDVAKVDVLICFRIANPPFYEVMALQPAPHTTYYRQWGQIATGAADKVRKVGLGRLRKKIAVA